MFDILPLTVVLPRGGIEDTLPIEQKISTRNRRRGIAHYVPVPSCYQAFTVVLTAQYGNDAFAYRFNIVRIHKACRITSHVAQRRDVRCNDRTPHCLCLDNRQSETFVYRSETNQVGTHILIEHFLGG